MCGVFRAAALAHCFIFVHCLCLLYGGSFLLVLPVYWRDGHIVLPTRGSPVYCCNPLYPAVLLTRPFPNPPPQLPLTLPKYSFPAGVLRLMKPSLQHNVTVSSSFNGLCQKFSLYISALSVFHQCPPAGRAERIIYVFVVTMQRRGVKHLFFLFRKKETKMRFAASF